MEKNAVSIIILGHVDHGKSTLIGRLLLDTDSLPQSRMDELKKIARDLGKDAELAYLTDQLKEEREQDRTIDTTQVYFKTRKKRYVIIDAPGHVEFINNMITGATCADIAMLIVDASKGIEEQTRRHIYIANMLGLKTECVALNKMDLVNYSEEYFLKLKNDLLELSGSLGIPAPLIIPISAKDGENIVTRSSRMHWHTGPCLAGALDSLKVDKDISNKPLRFAVQDVYMINNEKIAVGKVLSGRIRSGQNVTVFPDAGKTRVKAIRVFGNILRYASAGENIGLILNNMDSLKRGSLITEEATQIHPTGCIKADVFWMSDKPLETDKPVTLRCATQEVACTVMSIEKRMNSSTFEILEQNAGRLRLNEVGIITFEAKEPIVVEKFDYIGALGRCTIEADGKLCGAGIITTAARQNHTV